MPPVPMFARAIRGIEWITAAEATSLLGARVQRIGHRDVVFTVDGPDPRILDMRTADDAFFLAGTITGIDHTRASLGAMGEGARHLRLRQAVDAAESLRPGLRTDEFDVVASFLGRRNYNRTEIEDSIGAVIGAELGAAYRSRRLEDRPQTDLTWRVHLVDGEGTVGLRAADGPLHRRAYKTTSQVGTLHPPMAAAMALFSGLEPGRTLLDPFCGVGTIPIEAAAQRDPVRALGSDLSTEAVSLARANAASGTSRGAAFLVADAGRLPLRDASVDRLVTNPPWGRHLDHRGELAGTEWRFWRDCVRLLAPGGRIVALIEHPEAAEKVWRKVGLQLAARFQVSLFGTHPHVVALARRDEGAPPVPLSGLHGLEMKRQWEERAPDQT